MNSDDTEFLKIFQLARSVAIVGLSDKPFRDSYRVAAYLKRAGYRIIPVNPNATEILGERSYASLLQVPGPVDLVNIFRKPEAAPAIVDEAIAIGAKAIWMQLGVIHDAAARKAREAELQVVMDKCIMVEHARLLDR